MDTMMNTEALLKHAKRYGTDGVAETAADSGAFDVHSLTSLLVALDALDQANTPTIARRHKKVDVAAICQARAKKMLGIEDDDTQEAA